MSQRPTHQARRAKLAEKLRAQRQDHHKGSQGGPSTGADTALRRSGGVTPPGGEIEKETDDSDG